MSSEEEPLDLEIRRSLVIFWKKKKFQQSRGLKARMRGLRMGGKEVETKVKKERERE